MDDEQTMQQILQLVIAAMLGDQKALNIIQKVLEEAHQGNQQAILLMKVIQKVSLQIQGLQALSAKFGAKINYIKLLRGKCPDGYLLEYYKKGGQLCKKCVAKKKAMQDGGEVSQDPIENYKAEYAKKGNKMCKGKQFKMQNGGEMTDEEREAAYKLFSNYQRKGDYASADSIAANKFNDLEVLTNYNGKHPGKIGKDGKWTPDRSQSPYKKK